MVTGIFTDSSIKPDKQMMIDALGNTFKYWKDIKKSLEKDFGDITEEWKFFGKNTWWVLKLIHKGKNLLFITPCDKFFRISFIFGDKEVLAIEHSDLPNEVKTELRNAKKFIEGRGYHFNVKTQGDARIALKLSAIKLRNY